MKTEDVGGMSAKWLRLIATGAICGQQLRVFPKTTVKGFLGNQVDRLYRI